MDTGWEWTRAGGLVPLALPRLEGPDHDSVILLPGDVHEHSEAMLPLMVELASRITPWATWRFAPVISSGDLGIAYQQTDTVVICSGTAAQDILDVVLHEAWHMCAGWVRPGLLADLDDELRRGPAWPTPYLSSREERQARAFAAFGRYMVEGGRAVVSGAAAPQEASLFWHAFSGGLGREVLARRLPPRPSLASRLASLVTG